MRKCRVAPGSNRATDFFEEHPMDAEQINQISALLADLSARALELRGYL
jgi:hypothetical protein